MKSVLHQVPMRFSIIAPLVCLASVLVGNAVSAGDITSNANVSFELFRKAILWLGLPILFTVVAWLMNALAENNSDFFGTLVTTSVGIDLVVGAMSSLMTVSPTTEKTSSLYLITPEEYRLLSIMLIIILSLVIIALIQLGSHWRKPDRLAVTLLTNMFGLVALITAFLYPVLY